MVMRYLSAQEDAGSSKRRLSNTLTSLSRASCSGSCCPGREEKGDQDAERAQRVGVGVGDTDAWEHQLNQGSALWVTWVLGIFTVGCLDQYQVVPGGMGSGVSQADLGPDLNFSDIPSQSCLLSEPVSSSIR